MSCLETRPSEKSSMLFNDLSQEFNFGVVRCVSLGWFGHSMFHFSFLFVVFFFFEFVRVFLSSTENNDENHVEMLSVVD